jgi:acetyltransferase-like isoleucine patch superfamily enzyme
MTSALKQSSGLRRLRAILYRFWHRTAIRRRGSNHVVQLNDSLLHRCKIELEGKGNTLIIGSGTRLWDVSIRLIGEGLHCEIGPLCRLSGGQYQLEDRNSHLEVGGGTTMLGPMITVCEGGRVRVGSDCLVAYGTDIRNSDAHSVLDASTRARVNPAADVVIADHVWIGNGAQILKGVTIGPRAIVAARSVVTKDVAAGTLVAGLPARVIRENIDWDHRRL